MQTTPSQRSEGLRNALDGAIGRSAEPRFMRMLRKPARLVALALAERLGPALGRTWFVEGHPFFGIPMRLALPEHVSSQIYSFGFHELPLTNALLTFLAPGDLFVDVGAHFGYFSALAAVIVGPDGEVHSFEPTPSTFALLRQNARRFPAGIHLNHLAVTDGEISEVEISDLGIQMSAHNSLLEPRLPGKRVYRSRRVRVPATSLDRYFAGDGKLPAFVKIDAESAEMLILRGMDQTISAGRPVIAVEVGDYDLPGVAPSRELVAWLAQRDYQPYEMLASELRPHIPRERYSYDNLLFVPREKQAVASPMTAR